MRLFGRDAGESHRSADGAGRHTPRWIGALAAVGAGAVIWGVHRLTAPEPTDIFPDRLFPDEEPVGSAQRARALATNLNAPLLEGNHIELLENGDRIFPPMLEAIRQATDSVNLLTYIYWTGDIARQFAEALAEASARGVQVRVLLDAYGAAKMPHRWIREMRDAGCVVARFHSMQWYTLRRFNNRTHRKVLVVDGEVGFTGGVGIAEEWSGDAQDPGHWRDDHFRITGPAVRYLQGAFAENWREETGEALAGSAAFTDLEPTGEATVVPILGQPRGSISRIGFAYWLSIKAAEDRIRLITPYFSPDRDLFDVLVEAAERGVDVQILLPNHHIDTQVVRWVARTHYRRLLKAGCRIFEFQPTMMHTKVLTVDDDWAVIGSANFDNRSFDLNYEITLAVVDREFCAAVERSTLRDLERSREITLQDVKGWSLGEKLRDRLAKGLQEQI